MTLFTGLLIYLNYTVTIIEKYKNDTFHMFGKYKVQSVSTLDGFKYHFDDSDSSGELFFASNLYIQRGVKISSSFEQVRVLLKFDLYSRARSNRNSSFNIGFRML